ncbi:MAG: cytochrome c3 family protein [Limisphaerales bacterium]
MKELNPCWKTTACLVVAGLTLLGGMSAVQAQALNGFLTVRPLTPTEIKTYSLTGVQGASGLNTVGVGQPAYLEALVGASVAPANIVSVTWTITSKPIGSAAVLLPTPLGTNILTYKTADRISQTGTAYARVAWPGGVNTGNATNNGRTFLRPDVTGQYIVTATIVTVGSGTTNLTQRITAGTYVGVATCALCHSGSIGAEDIYHPWSQTAHATLFTLGIDGLGNPHYSKNFLPYTTVGYDTNLSSFNGGFDDLATDAGWVFPAVLTNGNWASMLTNYSQLAGLANVQCESCHGPGSEHAYSLGNTNVANWPRLAVTYVAADCAQCHDNSPNNTKSTEWNVSLHSHPTRTPSGGANRAQCVRCHTAAGFSSWAEAGGMAAVNANPYAIIPANPITTYEAITCQTCHDPHDATKPHQLRLGNTITLSDGTAVTNAGSGAFCMQCHNSRGGSVTNLMVKYPLNQPNWAGGVGFGPHDSPQADMLEGVNAVTYGKVIPSAAHANVVSNTCVGCHMQTVASTSPAFLKAGGHTFNMEYNITNNGVVTAVPLTAVCAQCHGNKANATFDFPVQDYNGDGMIEGVQTEVHHLLDKLSTFLPPASYKANANNYVADGLIKTSITTYTNMPAKFLNAAYNWQFVETDGSFGIHNAPYAVGLLKSSIADLTGDANNDGIADAWQNSYFGSYTNVLAAPNASPAGDGIPNWLKYSLGLNPMVAGIVLPNGVVWVNTSSIGGETNTVHIYTAAEIAFDTQVGTSYQIQSISNLGGGWSNVGPAIAGTGTTISYLTPTRSGAQQFFRVVHTP